MDAGAGQTLTWEPDYGVRADGGVRHVAPDVVHDVAVSLMSVPPPAAAHSTRSEELTTFDTLDDCSDTLKVSTFRDFPHNANATCEHS